MKPRPIVGKLLTTGHQSMESGGSPKSPLDLKILSPRGVVNCDVSRVGLGIVAALDTTSHCRSPDPIPVSDGGVEEESWDEEYTIVTRHMPNSSYDRSKGCIFDISSPPARPDTEGYPAPDFLSCCHLCNKSLHGKDIYMYRGDKAFCSIECRSREIWMDERKESNCSSEALSTSPAHIFSVRHLIK